MTRLALVALLVIVPAGARAQDALRPGDVFVRDVRARWMHGRQRPEFRAWEATDATATVRSSTPAGAERRALSLGVRGVAARLALDPRGRTTITGAEPSVARVRGQSAADSARYVREALAGVLDGAVLELPELRPPRAPSELRRGARWSDTVDVSAEWAGTRQSLRGRRLTTVLGDTVVGGRRLLRVRDSARVTFESRGPLRERTLVAPSSLWRRVTGALVGRALYDPAHGVDRERTDSASLSGTAELTQPDGRVLRTPARYERTRHLALYDSAEYASRRGALDEARMRARRASAGPSPWGLQPRERDSLVRVWTRSRDPDLRRSLFYPLWSTGDDSVHRRFVEVALAAGDTGDVVAELRRLWYVGRRPVTARELALLLPFMRDPALPFAFGLDRDEFYEDAAQALTTHPPAVTTDSARWPCTPEVCRALAAEWATAREPRLRVLALVAHATLDPAWGDSVLAYESLNPILLHGAVWLARGVGATWPAASNAPLPPTDAGWREWAEWMNGVKPEYAAQDTSALVRRVLGRRSLVRFDESHLMAIRYVERRTGRDVVAELRPKLAHADGDSARLVFSALLDGLGALRIDADSVAAALRSAAPAARERAVREMMSLFEHDAAAPDSATRVAVLGRVLDVVIDSAAPWPWLPPYEPPFQRWATLTPARIAPTSVVIVSDSLPAELRARWVARGARLVSPGCTTQAQGAGRAVGNIAITAVGPFVKVGVDDGGVVDCPDGGRRPRYGSGIWLYLLRAPAGWVAVSAGGWIT